MKANGRKTRRVKQQRSKISASAALVASGSAGDGLGPPASPPTNSGGGLGTPATPPPSGQASVDLAKVPKKT